MVAADLIQVSGRLRRAIRHRTRAEWGAAPLPDAELDLVRLVRSEPGLSIHDASAGLGVRANTVSTLVKRLEAAGLLERRRDGDDGRVVRLHLSAEARARIARWRDRRQAVVGHALDSLPEADRGSIACALPALSRLVERLGDDAQ